MTSLPATILVTGGAGFIGSAMIRHLIDTGVGMAFRLHRDGCRRARERSSGRERPGLGTGARRATA